MDDIIQYLRSHRDDHLGWVREVCTIPSISTKPQHNDDVCRAIVWTRDLLSRIGVAAEVAETGGHPAVIASHCEAAGQPTYLIYGHMDVQPEGDLKLWDAAPFEPVVKDGRLICRGSADNKGQVLLHVRAVAAWLATRRTLPVNVKFLIEGEEEISSPNLGRLIADRHDQLACDHIIISDTGMYAEGLPTITYGTRGLLYKEVRLHGPKHDLHSGSFGGTIANPANELAQLIAALHDDAGRVTIPGFYDDVVPATDAERGQIRGLPLSDGEYAASLGAPSVQGEAGYTTNERRWIRPTLDVNGIYGGFMLEGANTIIPKSAGAKISMRLVPNQSAKKLNGLFERAVRERCPQSVRVEILTHGQADAYMAPLDSAPMNAAKQALREAFGKDPAFVREGGSLPILPMFRDVLGADSLLIGFAGPHCNAHGPNENILLADLDRGAEAAARLLAYLVE